MYHAGCGENALDVASSITGDLRKVETFKRDADGLALLYDRVPTQAALQHLVHQVLEELAIITARRPPLFVVVRALKVVQFEIWTAYLFHFFILAANSLRSVRFYS